MEMAVIYSFGIYSSFMLLFVTTIFLIAQLREDNSVMDIAYGPLFALATWATIITTQSTSTPALIAGALVTLWAARLGIRIGKKNWGRPEDQRYAAWRTTWQERGQLYFILRSYIQINLLQGVIITIVSLPLIMLISAPQTALSLYSYIGIAVFGFGLLYESIADWQLDAYLQKKRRGKDAGEIMQTGLFRYSRRPNYFGESLIWWGLALIATPLTYGWIALASPVLITYIVTQVTGPMLEKIFIEKYPDTYGRYMQTTSYFIPLPPRKPAPQMTEGVETKG